MVLQVDELLLAYTQTSISLSGVTWLVIATHHLCLRLLNGKVMMIERELGTLGLHNERQSINQSAILISIVDRPRPMQSRAPSIRLACSRLDYWIGSYRIVSTYVMAEILTSSCSFLIGMRLTSLFLVMTNCMLH